MFKLRDYQQKGKDLIARCFREGDRRVMLWAMTGAGKGLMMADMVKSATDRGQKVLTVMRRRELIFQTIKNYKKYFGIESNAIMGNLKNDDSHLSTVASIDTLRNRILNPKYRYLLQNHFIIIDECHDTTSPTYKKLIWFLEGYDLDAFSEKQFAIEKQNFKNFYVGLTATPFRVGNKTHDLWERVVKPIECYELRDRGYLVPVRVVAPMKINVEGVRISSTGDYDEKEIFERVTKSAIVGDVVKYYKKLSMLYFGEYRPTIAFCVNQEHSKIMVAEFRKNGIAAIHCDASHSKEERDDAIEGLKSGRYKVLCNCNIFSTGFDAPWIEMELGLRPSLSENLVVQQWGRILRPFKICANCGAEIGGENKCYICGSSKFSYEKKFGVIVDHANNSATWGLPYDVREPELETLDRNKKEKEKKTVTKTCPRCFAVTEQSTKICELCGYDYTSKKDHEFKLNEVDGELVEIDAAIKNEKLKRQIISRFYALSRIETLREWNAWAKYFKLYETYGEKFFIARQELNITTYQEQYIREHYIPKPEKKSETALKLITN